MAVETEIQLIGGDKAVKVLGSLKNNIIDLRKPFNYILIYLQGRFSETFRKGGEKAWKPNSPVTTAIKGSSKPLHQDGYLKRSLTGPGRGSYTNVTTKKLEFGTTLHYAKYVEEGRTGVKVSPEFRKFVAAKTGYILGSTVTIPPRPFLYFIPKDTKKIEQILTLYFNQLISKEAS